jgi:hypothetical protein
VVHSSYSPLSPSNVRDVYNITNVLGPYTGSLKTSGNIQLLDETGAVLLTVPYSNRYPWPVAADATGHSIILASPSYGEKIQTPGTLVTPSAVPLGGLILSVPVLCGML